jgi:hypothetical protein
VAQRPLTSSAAPADLNLKVRFLIDTPQTSGLRVFPVVSVSAALLRM